MLFTLTMTRRPAADLGFLLHKHPERYQTFDVGFGAAHVLYPEISDDRCTAAMILDIDPVALVRGRTSNTRGSDAGLLRQYVNDRPYAASSFFSVALGRVFGSALNGQSGARAALAGETLPLTARVTPVYCHGGSDLIVRLFAPLGYRVTATRIAGRDGRDSDYFDVSLDHVLPLSQVLTHLYVLIPVLDDEKHYWIGEDEVGKLVHRGEGWLPQHPERDLIARRFLKHGRRLARLAIERLEELGDEPQSAELPATEKPATVRLNDVRLQRVADVIRAAGASSVVDLGCGEGKLLKLLLAMPQITRLVGMDVSSRTLDTAQERLGIDHMPERLRDKLSLIQGSLCYRDARLAGFDAAALVEVIEHIDPAMLGTAARVVFGAARPKTVVVTTPNAEYNAKFEALDGHALRHEDHRFEWTRAEFRTWAEEVARTFGYSVAFEDIGDVDPSLGAATQMGIFRCN